jgi:preprotein translocase SecF subunit
MKRLKLVPQTTNIHFMKFRMMAFVVSAAFVLLSVGLFGGIGLNTGIDFEGGILLEVKTEGPADLAEMRSSLGSLGLGEVALQEFGAPDDILIRVERQDGGAPAQKAAVDLVKQTLEQANPGIDYRREEFVGPKVSGELVESALLAVLTAVIVMLFYIFFRFDWQFSVGAVIAIVHDVILTVGFFALTRIEFNLASVAAILTIVGYSINDTVVVYDRVRENLRKYKQKPLGELLSQSINDTLSRTVMTSVTTLLALLALFFFGGEVIRGFSAALIWGVVIGTYSSIFIAAPLLLVLGLQRGERDDSGVEQPEKV